MKSLNVASWHHQTLERRPLKRNRLGPPDVYPQDVRQEEDNLGADRLKKGYQVAVTSYEHESAWNTKVARLDRLDETMTRGAQMVMQVLNKKLDLNATLDKDRKRYGKEVFQNFSHTVGQAGKSKERKEWFTDLARGKSLASLAGRPPFFRKKEDALEYLCDYKVPVARALWFLKLVAVGQGSVSTVNKQKKATNDQIASEHASLFTKFLKVMLTQMSDSAKLDTNIVYTDRWPQFVCICKHAYEEGMIERQEFLMDLCDILADRFVQRAEKPHFFTLFRLFLSFFAQFIDQMTQNLLLARRCAFLVSKRLGLYKKEMEDALGRPVNASEMFEEMLQCQNQRAIILILTGMLYAILIDCPGALIWNGFKVAEGRPPPLLHHLCGSPLDLLPCSVEELPLPPGHGSEKLQELVQIRVAEIKRRSRAVENRWSLNQTQKTGFAQTVQTCLEILGALDSARYDQPRCIEKIYNTIFNGPQREKFEHEHAIRIKMLLQWAVTVEREGTHRALTVASVLALRVNHRRGFRFGDQQLQEILLEYLDTEGPQPSQPHFNEEFANLMHLFVELQRAGVFSHDSYVKGLITTGEMSDQMPVMNLIKTRERCSASSSAKGLKAEGGLGFKSEKGSKAPIAMMRPDETDEHPLLGPELTAHERFLIHLPIPQTYAYRSECNQRSLMLYGIGEQRDTVKNELKKAAREITKIWTKRIVVEFSFSKPSEIRFKKRATREQISEALQKFKSQTYYDQVVLCGWCCDNFISMITEFADGHSTTLPTSEGLDVLLGMMEHCKNISGIMVLAEELLPLLAAVERTIAARRVDCVPSIISAQLSFVLVAYISHNYYYFLHSENAPEIVSGLYRIIENQLKPPSSCLTGWGRTIGIFVLYAKKQLIEAKLTHKKIDGKRELLMRLLPPWKPSTSTCSAKYNSHLFKEFLDDAKRMFSFNDYRRLHLQMEAQDAPYSFVVSALLCARQCGNDYDRLVELANMCGHVSAQNQLSSVWCNALQALCCSSVAGNHGFADLLLAINVEDSSCHYNIATFYMLLASRNCFSMNALFHQLLHTALSSLLKSDPLKADVDAEAGVCLALLVLANMVCQSDQPILLSPVYTGGKELPKHVSGQADKWVLSAGHLHDIGDAIFEILFTICILADYTKSKLRDRLDDSRNEHSFRREFISQLSKAVLMAMCEQDWVTQRVYRKCEETGVDGFSSSRLKRNCLGQQLLRMALRRKCERNIVQELTVCNGNSKKSLIDKLLAVLNIWNIRATYFDLKLMIKEVSPEGSSSKHAQQGAIAADALIGEIGRCCRDLFTSSHRCEKKLPDAAVGRAFRLKHITSYWLISPLVHICPKPGNLPPSFPAVTTVQAKFLKEAASMLDTASDSSRERIQQSAWLLSQEPFLNLVLTCLKGEDQQRDGLVGSLLKQLQDLTAKTKENPALPYLRKFSLEREGLLLRLSLIGGMFDSVCHPSNCDSWALLFFQLMLYGVVSRERDRFLFESCFDMLSTLLVWSITDPMNSVPANSQDPDTKYRFANYSQIVKRLRKELNERALIPELRCLMQFLPIPKPTFELITCEAYGTQPLSPQKFSKMGSSPNKVTRQGLQFGEKIKLSAYDMTQNFTAETTVKRTWTWAMFQAVKLDRCPVPVQRHIQRLIQHAHYNEFVRPTICGMDRNPSLDIYLSPPTMDVSETPVSVHHVSASTTVTTATSVASVATSIAPSLVSASSTGGMDMQAVSSSTVPVPQSRTLSFQSTGGQMAVPQTPSGDAMMFSGQTGPMQGIPDMTRNQANSSPRSTRGGRRKNAAGGQTGRSQGGTRKKQQRQPVDQNPSQGVAASQMGGQQMSAGGNTAGPNYWASQPPAQSAPMQQFASSGQPVPMNQPEDSKMKIHSMILKRQAQAASGSSTQNNFQNMAPSSSGQYNPMMMKMDNTAIPMDHQQTFPSGPQTIQISQDPQGSQFGSQQRAFSQQSQSNNGNAFDNRMMGHQQQQPQQQMTYGQQQYQQQY